MVRRLTEEEIEEQFSAARAATLKDQASPWWPVKVRYDSAADRIDVTMRSKAVLSLPRGIYKELAQATPKQLAAVEVAGEALRWDSLDVDISFPGLLRRLLGDRFFNEQAGRVAGSVRSDAKAAAARANGAKGGRPRKIAL